MERSCFRVMLCVDKALTEETPAGVSVVSSSSSDEVQLPVPPPGTTCVRFGRVFFFFLTRHVSDVFLIFRFVLFLLGHNHSMQAPFSWTYTFFPVSNQEPAAILVFFTLLLAFRFER